MERGKYTFCLWKSTRKTRILLWKGRYPLVFDW